MKSCANSSEHVTEDIIYAYLHSTAPLSQYIYLICIAHRCCSDGILAFVSLNLAISHRRAYSGRRYRISAEIPTISIRNRANLFCQKCGVGSMSHLSIPGLGRASWCLFRLSIRRQIDRYQFYYSTFLHRDIPCILCVGIVLQIWRASLIF